MANQGRPPKATKIDSLKLVPGGIKATSQQMTDTEDGQQGYRCTSCGKVYNSQAKNFSASNSPLYAGNNGYITVCRSCLEKYYKRLVEAFDGNEEKAIDRCCQVFDWYYSDEAAAMTKKLAADKTRIGLYPSKINMIQVREKGTTYLDTIAQRNSAVIHSVDDLQYMPAHEEDGESVNLEECLAFFGSGYTPEEYVYLSEQYSDWTTRYECNSKAQEEVFKNLSVQQLVVQRTQRKGSAKEVADAIKTLQELLGTANIKPSQNNDNALAEQNTFGTLIKKWENEKPIPEPSPEWEDVDGIKKYIQVWFVGHLCKMFKIKNKYSDMYEREIAKYTVSPPNYEEEDGNFDAVFGKDIDTEEDGDANDDE